MGATPNSTEDIRRPSPAAATSPTTTPTPLNASPCGRKDLLDLPRVGAECRTNSDFSGSLRDDVCDDRRSWDGGKKKLAWLHEGAFNIVKEADDTLRFVTEDGRTIPRHGYRREDFVDDDVVAADESPSAEGFCARGPAAIYRLRRAAAT